MCTAVFGTYINANGTGRILFIMPHTGVENAAGTLLAIAKMPANFGLRGGGS
jgi:hypothetical protein